MRRRMIATAWVAGVLVLAGCTSPAVARPVGGVSPPVSGSASASGSTPGAPRDYRPGAASIGDPLFPSEGNGGYDVAHYAISVGYLPSTRKLTGEDVVTATATQDLSRFDLDLHGLTVAAVAVNGAAATFNRVSDKLVITPARGIDDGTTFTTDIHYGGTPEPYSDPELGFVGFIPETDGALAQGEPDVAATWFPVNDHPRDKASYDISITVPSALAALSNGVLVSKTVAGADTTWHWRESAPMASYLATAVIGRYRVATSIHDGLPVVTAVQASLPTKVDAVLARTPEVVDFLVTQFGPYPFDAMGGIVHNDSRVGFALENQTRPVYAPGFFAQKGNDGSWVLAHELAHQWYGDSLSVQDWSDVWLNEGFATYAEWLWSEHTGGQTPRQIFDDVYHGRNGRQLVHLAPAAPIVRTLFSDAVYTRGGATLEALRITVGDAMFFQIIRGWAADHAGQNVSTAEFIAYVDQVTGKKLDDFLQAWLYEGSVPPYPTALAGG